MRTTNYSTVMAYGLAVLAMLVFAAAPTMAASQEEPAGATGSRPVMQQGTGGEMHYGAKGDVSREMKREITGQQKPTSHPRSEMTGEVRGRVTTERKAGGTSAPKAEMMERGAVRGEQERGMVRREATAPVASRGAQAVVVRVDRPENCLRVRSAPSLSREVIGCAVKGQTLHLTGVFSSDGRWAQLDNNGWVYFNQVTSDLKPPRRVVSTRRTSASDDEWWDSDWELAAGAGSRSEVSEGSQMYDYSYGSPSYYSYGPGYYAGRFGYGPPRPGFLPPPPPPPPLPRP